MVRREIFWQRGLFKKVLSRSELAQVITFKIVLARVLFRQVMTHCTEGLYKLNTKLRLF